MVRILSSRSLLNIHINLNQIKAEIEIAEKLEKDNVGEWCKYLPFFNFYKINEKKRLTRLGIPIK